MSDEQFIKDFQINYTKVFNYTGGHDSELMNLLATKYTLAKREFSGVKIQKTLEEIQLKLGKPIDIKSGYALAFSLFQTNNFNDELENLSESVELLLQAEFKPSSHLILGAFYLNKEDLKHIERARILFNELNRQQRFLTSKEDIPYIIYLTKQDADGFVQANTIVQYYTELRKHHFAMGNHLQALAQILTLYDPVYHPVLIQYVVRLKDELLLRDVKVKRHHYTYLGVLALAATNEFKIEEIVSLYRQLVRIPPFKGAKEQALTVAIQKVIQDVLEVQNLVHMSSLSKLGEIVDMLDVVLIIDFSFDIFSFIDF